MKRIAYLSIVAAIVMAPLVVLADTPSASNPSLYYGTGNTGYETPTSQGWGGGMTFASFVAGIIGVINTIIPVLITIALLIFFIGLVRYVIDAEDAHAHSQGGKFILWGLVAMFVLLSLWGILDVAKTSIFGGTSTGTTTAAPTGTASTASQNVVVGP